TNGRNSPETFAVGVNRLGTTTCSARRSIPSTMAFTTVSRGTSLNSPLKPFHTLRATGSSRTSSTINDRKKLGCALPTVTPSWRSSGRNELHSAHTPALLALYGACSGEWTKLARDATA